MDTITIINHLDIFRFHEPTRTILPVTVTLRALRGTSSAHKIFKLIAKARSPQWGIAVAVAYQIPGNLLGPWSTVKRFWSRRTFSNTVNEMHTHTWVHEKREVTKLTVYSKTWDVSKNVLILITYKLKLTYELYLYKLNSIIHDTFSPLW